MRDFPGRLEYTSVSLKAIIQKACEVRDFQISGPDWLGSARFDVVAKLPANTPASKIPGMLRRRVARLPRMRRCLLKGCEQGFRPRQVHQRYCSRECREEARQWSRWKAQQQYRATAAGQQTRNRQSVRYRKRVKNRKPPPPEAVNEPARVITPTEFFR
jgi:hypothetical protein